MLGSQDHGPNVASGSDAVYLYARLGAMGQSVREDAGEVCGVTNGVDSETGEILDQWKTAAATIGGNPART
jgi:hypothetical protein